MKTGQMQTAALCYTMIAALFFLMRQASASAFSDANWISMGGINGAAGNIVGTSVADESGNLYVGGYFTVIGDVVANYIAKWDGTNWTALGSGMNEGVLALAVSGNDLYAGGSFTTAGGSVANYVAKWNGTSWTAVDSGMSNVVRALAVSGADVYAAEHVISNRMVVNRIVKWNGSSWTTLGLGMNSVVHALAVSGSDLYAGGAFTNVDGNPINYIANGTETVGAPSDPA